MKDRYICIHGHFYQPPRENPWLNEVEMQDSAYPFHDWNERITAECYARNLASRILNGEGKIIDIVNNYSRISFNFGPTLLQWMEQKAPDVYEGILLADQESQKRFSGHGSALAQVYNHMIMPLANERDKITQVIWGIRDFQKRFGRDPEGMWLSETAVDIPTLEVLANHGIKFTILSPYQAKSVKEKGKSTWHDVSDGSINPRKPYFCSLPSGKKISIFFYDGPISQAVAFENLLNSGETFASRLEEGFIEKDGEQLMHIATDGETYGHHHRLGEMALSYALHHIEAHELGKLTIYAEYLEKFPPAHEVEIIEDSSWSCIHGIERWRSDCGCNTGGHSEWNQKWRKPLREAFDWVRDELVPLYEQEMKKYTSDPWKVRNEYIDVLFDRSQENMNNFLDTHFGKELTRSAEAIKVLKLLEMQLHAMLMYTSCGWFFDEVTGIESMQDVFYASRAVQLAEDISQKDLETNFIKLLEQAPSNIPEFGNAATAYNRFVKTTMLDLLRVGAHYAISSIFSEYPEESKIYSFKAKTRNYELLEAGKQKLVIGRADIKSEITWEEKCITFSVLHMGEHNLFGGVREFIDDTSFSGMQQDISAVFQEGNIHEILVQLDRYFGGHNYSFWHLFRDEQRRVLNQLLQKTLEDIENVFYQIYENNHSMMLAIRHVNMNLPMALNITGEYIVNSKLKQFLKQKKIDFKELQKLIREVQQLSVKLDEPTLNFIASQRITYMVEEFEKDEGNISLIQETTALLQVMEKLPLSLDIWKAQNICFLMNKNYYDDYEQKAKQGDAEAQKWLDLFNTLTEKLNMKI